jgi:hypothetical protein
MIQPQELQPLGDVTPADLEVPLELSVKPKIVAAVGRPGEDDLDILRQKGELVGMPCLYCARSWLRGLCTCTVDHAPAGFDKHVHPRDQHLLDLS